MERESDVIRRKMHAKRQAIKDKIHLLESTVLGTVENAATVATDAVENVKETVEETVESVTHALDPRPRVRQHPVAAMTGSLVTGFLVGCLVPPLRGRKQEAEMPSLQVQPTNGSYGSNGKSKKSESGFSPLSLLSSVIGPGLELFKKKALKETSSFIHDMVQASVPEEFRPKATELIDKALTSLGAEPISTIEDAPSSAQTQAEGEADEQRNEHEMGRSMGSAQGPHQRNLGKYYG